MSQTNDLVKNLKSLSRRFSEAIASGYARISVYPSRINTHAALMTAGLLAKIGCECEIEFTLEPEKSMESSLVISRESPGRGVLRAYSGKGILIGDKTPPPIQILYVIEEVVIVTGVERAIAFSSMFQEGLKPNEKDYAIELAEKTDVLSVNRKFIGLYGCDYKPLSESLHATLHPYIPGFTGERISSITSKLSEIGIDGNKLLTDYSKDDIKKLIDYIVGVLGRESKLERTASELVSPLITASVENLRIDLKEIAGGIDVILEENPSAIVELYNSALPIEYVVNEYYRTLPEIANSIKSILRERYLRKKNCIIIIRGASEFSRKAISLTSDLLREFGFIRENEILAIEYGGKVYTSMYELCRVDKNIAKKILRKARVLKFPIIEVDVD